MANKEQRKQLFNNEIKEEAFWRECVTDELSLFKAVKYVPNSLKKTFYKLLFERDDFWMVAMKSYPKALVKILHTGYWAKENLVVIQLNVENFANGDLTAKVISVEEITKENFPDEELPDEELPDQELVIKKAISYKPSNEEAADIIAQLVPDSKVEDLSFLIGNVEYYFPHLIKSDSFIDELISRLADNETDFSKSKSSVGNNRYSLSNISSNNNNENNVSEEPAHGHENLARLSATK